VTDVEDVPLFDAEKFTSPPPKKYRREVAPRCRCGDNRVRRDPFGVPLDECDACMVKQHVKEPEIEI
jgi:hypothetical protein